MSTGSDTTTRVGASPFRPDSRLTPELAAAYRADGSWRDRTLGSNLRDSARKYPDRVAAIGYDGSGAKTGALTYAELNDLVDRLAAGLIGLGVRPGDAVSVMLPNWVEFGALIYAIAEIGGIYSGIPASYGSREVGFMLRRVKSKVLVVPETFRGRDFVEFARQMRREAPNVEQVVVVGRAPAEPGCLSLAELASARPVPLPAVDPNALVHVGFTSGTTGEPKGVMNSHQTLDAVMWRYVEHHGPEMFNADSVDLVASPVGHHTGFLWGVVLSAYLGARAVYLDQWDRVRAAEVLRSEGVTFMMGAPTFLQDLIQVPGIGPGSLKIYVPAGGPIPRTLPRQASELLGCFVCPGWGMTEWGIGICGSIHLPRERVMLTDGVPVAGCEVRVMAGDREAERGREGDLQIRGAGLFLGYFDRPDFTREAFTEDGWFLTGDRAVMHPDGFVSLSGRTKDIIIRGGENIPVVEIETLLYQHPAILEVSVVGYPDERLGERACAVVVCKPGQTVDLPDLAEFLLARGMSKHFLPERVELVDALPKTMSGKIRKVELRQWLATGKLVIPEG